MDIKKGELFHRFVIFTTDDGKNIKVVSKLQKDRRVAAEIVIEANGKESVHKFTDSANNKETFESRHFNEIINSLKEIKNGKLKQIAQKKFFGIWNFIGVREIPVDEIMS